MTNASSTAINHRLIDRHEEEDDNDDDDDDDDARS
jgi:hypothetical protein